MSNVVNLTRDGADNHRMEPHTITLTVRYGYVRDPDMGTRGTAHVMDPRTPDTYCIHGTGTHRACTDCDDIAWQDTMRDLGIETHPA